MDHDTGVRVFRNILSEDEVGRPELYLIILSSC